MPLKRILDKKNASALIDYRGSPPEITDCWRYFGQPFQRGMKLHVLRAYAENVLRVSVSVAGRAMRSVIEFATHYDVLGQYRG